MPVSTLRRATLTPGTAAPAGSVTRPDSEACCAKPAAVKNTRQNSFISLPQCEGHATHAECVVGYAGQGDAREDQGHPVRAGPDPFGRQPVAMRSAQSPI